MTARSDTDVESLRKRTYRPLDVFLLVSIIFLFLALLAVVAAVVIAVKRPECFVQGGKDGSAAYKVRKVLLDQKVGNVSFLWSMFSVLILNCVSLAFFLNRWRTLCIWTQKQVSLIFNHLIKFSNI